MKLAHPRDERRTWASFRDKDGGLQSAESEEFDRGDSFKDADLIAHRHFVLRRILHGFG